MIIPEKTVQGAATFHSLGDGDIPPLLRRIALLPVVEVKKNFPVFAPFR